MSLPNYYPIAKYFYMDLFPTLTLIVEKTFKTIISPGYNHLRIETPLYIATDMHLCTQRDKIR